MITEFKKFESVNNSDPKIGDYVICKDKQYENQTKDIDIKFNDYMSTHVGQYISENNGYFDFATAYRYIIEFKDIPDYLQYGLYFKKYENKHVRGMERNEILYFSPDKEECEDMLLMINNINRYNI